MKRKASETAAKTTGQILRDNICTLFNLLNLLIAIALIFVHAWSNLFFVPVVALNTIIGIAQELKAKRLIEKLTLLSQSNAKIERNGELHSVPIAEVQEQDILLLESGNQICADAMAPETSRRHTMEGTSALLLEKPLLLERVDSICLFPYNRELDYRVPE